jgi:hypothetical protein
MNTKKRNEVMLKTFDSILAPSSTAYYAINTADYQAIQHFARTAFNFEIDDDNAKFLLDTIKTAANCRQINRMNLRLVIAERLPF